MKSELRENKNLWKTLLSFVAAFALYKLAGQLMRGLTLGTIPRLFAGEAILVVLVLAAAAVTGRMGTLRPVKHTFFRGLLPGIWMILTTLLTLLLWIGREQEVTASSGEVVMFLAYVLMVGVAEELLCRGILLNGFLDAWGEASPASVRKAVIVSGLCFGALHIFNMLRGVSVTSALIQAVGAAMSGILLGAIYVRARKNLWVCIALHTFLDFGGFLSAGILSGASVSDAISYGPSALVNPAIELLIALFLLRRKKLLPLLTPQEHAEPDNG